jgi:hypothetical protein
MGWWVTVSDMGSSCSAAAIEANSVHRLPELGNAAPVASVAIRDVMCKLRAPELNGGCQRLHVLHSTDTRSPPPALPRRPCNGRVACGAYSIKYSNDLAGCLVRVDPQPYASARTSLHAQLPRNSRRGC